MTTHVRHNGEFCTTGITLGDVRSVLPHTGLDGVAQARVQFAHGFLELSAAELERLLQLAVVAKLFAAVTG